MLQCASHVQPQLRSTLGVCRSLLGDEGDEIKFIYVIYGNGHCQRETCGWGDESKTDFRCVKFDICVEMSNRLSSVWGSVSRERHTLEIAFCESSTYSWCWKPRDWIISLEEWLWIWKTSPRTKALSTDSSQKKKKKNAKDGEQKRWSGRNQEGVKVQEKANNMFPEGERSPPPVLLEPWLGEEVSTTGLGFHGC